MKTKQKTFYDKKTTSIERRFSRLRRDIERELRPLIKEKALSLNRDCINTQWTFSIEGDKPETQAFEKLHTFINTCSDEFHIDFYFQVNKGKFEWLD